MRLKSVIAPNMPEGMRRVREQLGEDAIIVSTEQTENGVLITAATERPDLPLPPEPEAIPPAPSPAPADPSSSDEGAAERSASAPLGTSVRDCLAFHGVPAPLARRVASAASAGGGASAEEALGGALDRTIGFSPLDAGAVRHPLMLIGEPGAGKTVVLAKLATQAKLAGREVTAITADTARSGGMEQLAAFMRAIGADLRPVGQAPELAAAILSAAPESLILIDTPAINPLDAGRSPLRQYLSERIEPLLVLPAGLQPEDAAEAAAVLTRTLGVRRLIAARVDTARRYGAVVAAAAGGRISLAGLSDSRRIADPVKTVDSHAFARVLFNQIESNPGP